MNDDAVPNFPETSPQDYDSQDNEENEENDLDDIQEVPEQPPEIITNRINQINNIPYQNTMNQIPNNDDDILLRSSLDILDSSNPTYSTQIINSNIEQLEPEIAQPIYQYNQPIQNMGIQGMNMSNEYNDNNMNNINNTISYQVEINKPMLESQYNSQFDDNNNNIEISNKKYATVKPINNTNNDITYINNNNQINEGMNPPYIQREQNIIYSTPIPQRTNLINSTENINNNNNIYYSAPFSPTMPKISPINYVTKLSTPNTNYIHHFNNDNENININNINNINSGINNLNINNPKNEVTIKLTGKNPNINNNINNNMNNANALRAKPRQKNINYTDNFSPDSWTLFYPEKEPFFTSMNFEDSISNQRIENPSKNETYFGQVNNSRQKHGFGKLFSPLYERIGTWINDRFQGWGREIRKNGEIYEGKFVNNILNGKGKYKYGNTLYIGDFVNYDRHGKGELFTENYHYIGDFDTNRFHGKGRIEIYDKGIYEGDFKNDEMTGYGIFKYDNGEFYEGNFVEGKKEGKGIMKTSEGKIYEGIFINDEYKGNKRLQNNKYQYKSNKRNYE